MSGDGVGVEARKAADEVKRWARDGFPVIPAIPVGEWWLRVNPLSAHEAIFPSQGPTRHDRWWHAESSTARWLLPTTQSVSSKKFVADGQCVLLEGHDAGPMLPHGCHPPDNALIALTLIGSSCTWPVNASRRQVEGKSVCAFLHVLIPYLHCYARKGADDKKSDGKKSKAGGQQSPGEKRAGNPYESAMQTETAENFLRDLPSQLPGLGFFMIMTSSQTVMIPLGFWDIVAGWARVFVSMAFDSAWKQLKIEGPAAKVLQDCAGEKLAAPKGVYKRLIAEKMLEKTFKGFVKGFYSGGSIGLPCSLAKFDVKTGQFKIWTKDVGDPHWKPSDWVMDHAGWNAILKVPPPDSSPADEARKTMVDQLIEGAPHAG